MSPTCDHEEASSLFCPICERTPAVDVERELYDALKAMADAHADDWYDDVNCVKNARAAIDLYEAKGRLKGYALWG